MKTILSYGNYFSYGKDYQVTFIYDNEEEAQNVNSYLKQFEENKLIKPYHSKFITQKNDKKPITVISKTNIPKEILLPFISMLISINNLEITIGNEKFTTFNIDKIQNAIDKLHINATLNKGKFLNLGDTYYVTFRYSSEEQIDELSYYFNCKLNYTETSDIYPIAIDKSGNLTNKNNGTIIGSNIPKGKLKEFIKDFIQKYNMIITIGNAQLKDNFNEEELEKAISSLDVEELGRIRTRTKQGTR